MIEILKKYYGINLEFYKNYNNGILFSINGDYYYLFNSVLIEAELEMVNEFVISLKERINFHNIILNNEGSILSDGYVLIKLNSLIDDVSLYDIYKYNISVSVTNNEPFHIKWRNRIDYLEIQLAELCENKLINNSFDYFVGVAEQLMSFIADNYNYHRDTYLVHRNIYNLNSIDFYNPENIYVGNKYNDILSYIYFYSDWELLYKVLDSVDANDRIYFFVKLAFPFKYFYFVNMYVTGDSSKECNIKKIVDDISSYERFLKKLESIFKYNVFYWIKKDN